MRRLFGVLLALVVAGSLFAVAQKEATGAEAPLKLSIIHEICWGFPDSKTELVLAMEKELNVDVEWVPCPGSGGGAYETKLNLLLAANDLPDIFETYWNEKAITQGTADLSMEEMRTYMPDYTKAVEDFMVENGMDVNGTWERYKRDGVLKHYPMVWTGAAWGWGILWRKDYLDELGLGTPKTLEDWEAAFAAYKRKYPDRFAYGSRAGQNYLYRTFSAVPGAFGIVPTRYMVKDGKLVPSWTQPEMLQALTVLNRWYERGYLDPEFVTETNEGEAFTAGIALMRHWVHAGSWDMDDPDLMKDVRANNPDAEFVLTTPPVVAGYKPAIYAWNPFHGNGHGIGRNNNNDRDRVHRIMEVVNRLASDKDLAMTGSRGIKGKHWDYVNGTPTTLEPYASMENAGREIGTGVFGRMAPFYTYWKEPEYLSPRDLKQIDEVRFNPNGILGSNNLYVNTISPVDARNADGEDLNAVYDDLMTEREALFYQIIVGQKPVSAWNDFIRKWNTQGGQEIDRWVNQNSAKFYVSK
jgi:putative aldouronate transport system substrate-binding protein